MDKSAEKKRLRDAIAERLQRLPDHLRLAESRSVCRRVIEHLPKEPFRAAVYFPMRSEVDVRPLIEELLKRGCTLFMPRAEGKGFEFRQIHNLTDLVPGPFGIKEPTDKTDLIDKTTVQYIFTPGSAFDRMCNRLGRGSGGYDKWLKGVRAVNPDVQVWGLCLDWQLVNDVPIEAHDQPMDAVVTPRELLRPTLHGQKKPE
jgi:5-formyltetrahydrofolate cyclo-ligase